MDRPRPQQYRRPEKIAEYPMGPAFRAGFLVDVSSGMRTFRPVINAEKCVNCLRCFLVCPEGSIDKSGPKPEVDYDYCKGCGICEHECRVKAIRMEKEVAER